MAKLIEKLEASQCGCDWAEGKTIAKTSRYPGCYWIRFTDGTWLFADYQQGVYELIEQFAQDSYDCNPFVELGLATTDEIKEFWREFGVERDREAELRDLMTYERLKQQFEPQSLKGENAT